jgi:hypothetical protein
MRPTIQIYEGPDGSGKTFHVERVMAVARRNGLRSVRIHHAPPQDWVGEYTFREYYAGRTLDAIHEGYDVIVLDRCFVSNMVYSDLQGVPSFFSDSEAEYMAGLYAALGASYWYVDRESDAIRRCLEQRGEIAELGDVECLKGFYDKAHRKIGLALHVQVLDNKQRDAPPWTVQD